MKIIGGYSTEDSISFSTEHVRTTLHENGICEFVSFVPSGEQKNENYKKKIENEKELIIERSEEVKTKNPFKKILCFFKVKMIEKKRIENKKSKLKYPFTIKIFFDILFELILMFFSFKFNLKFLSLFIAILGLIVSLYYILKAIFTFKKLPSLRWKHGAEHMIYNASLKEKMLTFDNVKKYPIYCNRCGSSKPANLLFLSFINICIALLFRIWVPFSLLLFISFNLNRVIPGNFLAYFYQKFLTLKPNDKDLLLAMQAMEIVKNTDEYLMKGNDITELVFNIIVKYSINQVKKNNGS